MFLVLYIIGPAAGVEWQNTQLFSLRSRVCIPPLAPGACIIKLITAVINGFCNKLKCLSLNTRLGWKGSPGTNTLACYGNRKLQQ